MLFANKLRLLLIVVLLLQAGCGFHLRGSARFPAQLNPLYIEPGNLPAEQLSLVRSALRKASARLTDNPQSSHRLRVSFGTLNSRLLASSSPTGIELRRISMPLVFHLEDSSGRVLIEDQQVMHSSDVELDTANLLAHEEIIENIREGLQTSLLQSMIFKLQQL